MPLTWDTEFEVFEIPKAVGEISRMEDYGCGCLLIWGSDRKWIFDPESRTFTEYSETAH